MYPIRNKPFSSHVELLAWTDGAAYIYTILLTLLTAKSLREIFKAVPAVAVRSCLAMLSSVTKRAELV